MSADFQVFLNVLLAIAAGVVTVGGALSVIERFTRKPHGIVEKVRLHEERLDRDHKRLNELESSSRLIMRGIMQLMNHELDGNHIAQLKAVRDEIEKYLINR